jgi:hypothetical protein
MEPTAIAALGALFISTLGMIFQSYKFIQELRERAKLSKEDATKAEAERDSIAVKNSEGTLLMMKGMLDVFKASDKELRTRVKELEDRERLKELRIRELEAAVIDREKQLHREREEYAEAQKLFEERMREVARQYEQKLQELQGRIEMLETKNGEETDLR